MTDVTIFVSNPLFLFLLWVFFIMIAEETKDVIIYFTQIAFGIPLGIHFLYIAPTTGIIYDITGTVIILISCYFVYIGTAETLRRK